MKTTFLLSLNFAALVLSGCGSGSSGSALTCGPGTTNANGACVPIAGAGGSSAGGAAGAPPVTGGAGGMTTGGGSGSAGGSAGGAGKSAGGTAGSSGWTCAPAMSMPLPWMPGSDPKDLPCVGVDVNCSGSCKPDPYASQHTGCFDPAGVCSAGIVPIDPAGAPAVLKRGGTMGIRTPSHPGTMQLACAPFCGTDLAMWVADTGAVYAFHVRIPIESNFPGEAGDPTIVWYAPPSWQIYLPGFNRGGFPPCFYSPDVPPPIGYVDVVVYTSDPSAKASNFVVYWANSSPEPSNPHNVNSILKNQCLVDHPK